MLYPYSIIPKLAVVGDSITYATIGSNLGNNVYNLNRGHSFWASFLTGRRIYTNQSLNFGINGDTTSGLLARLTDVMASDAGIYWVLIGTNDIGVHTTEQIITNLKLIWNALLKTGAVVIASTILPRNLASATSRDQIHTVNQFIRSQAYTTSRLFIVDPTVDYGDPLSTTMAPRTNYSYDGLHPKAIGSFYHSKQAVALLNQLIPAQAVPFASYTDTFSATNTRGNLLTNGLLDGTGGTLANSGGGTVSGTVADSWGINTSNNGGGTLTSLTVTASKVTLTDGRPGQRIVLGGTYTGAGSSAVDNGCLVGFTQDNFNSLNLAAGDKIKLSADISVAAGLENIAGIEAYLYIQSSAGTFISADGSCITGDLMPSDAFSGVFETPEFTVPDGVITWVRASIRLYLYTAGTSVAADVTIGGVTLRKGS